MSDEIIFNAIFENLRKDRDGEIKITFTVPLSDEHIARLVPIQTQLKLAVIDDNPKRDKRQEQSQGCDDSQAFL